MNLTFTIIIVNGSHRRLKVSRGLLLDLIGHGVDFEAVQSGYKLVGWSLGPILRMDHEQHVWKACAEVRPVDVVVT